MTSLLRRDINNIVAYVPGKPMSSIRGNGAIKRIVKLNSNENALGASGRAKQAIGKNIGEIFRYPDGSSADLKKAIAKKLGARTENISLGNGSDEVIDTIVKTFLNPGESILTSELTFVEYEIIARANGFKAVAVPLKDFTYDLDEMQRRISKKTKIIFIANPNNPTGTYVAHNGLMRFIKRVASNRIVVIDEAYLEFVDADDFPQLIVSINSKNIILMRTFSKAYGLAGLRLGYAIAKKEFVAAMEKIRQPFNINFFAQKAGEAVLGDTQFIAATRKVILSEKYRIYKALKAMQLPCIPTQANFIMFSTPLDSLELCKRMARAGVLIRDLKQYGLDTYVRVTIGTKIENDLFLQTLKKILKK